MATDDVSTETLTQTPASSVRSGVKLAVVLAGHRLLDEADAARIQEFLVLLLRVDDHEAALVIFEVPLDQRQRPLADRAEANHHDGAADAAVDGPGGHRELLLGRVEHDLGGFGDRPVTPAASRVLRGPGQPGAPPRDERSEILRIASRFRRPSRPEILGSRSARPG